MKKSPFLIFPFEVKEIKEDDNFFIVKGYASTFGNIDLGFDIVEQGAFTKDLLVNGNQRPILWQHNTREPIGIGLFSIDEKGLLVEMRLPKDDDFVKGRVMPQIRTGSVKGLSIGYKTIDYTNDSMLGARRLKELQIKETSPVTFPMNEQALITAAKEFLESCEDDEPEIKAVPPYKNFPVADMGTAWDKKKAVTQIRANTGSQEKPSARYKNGFMYYDPENADQFTAYKLPYVYWMDGGFKAIPRALSAIVGALAGARGGLKIPEADKLRVKAHIRKYYKKMGREDPFPKNDVTFFDSFDVEFMDRQDLLKAFNVDDEEKIILSNGAKQFIIDRLSCKDNGGSTDKKNDNDLLNDLKELNKIL